MTVVCRYFYKSCIMLPCICLYCALFWLVITFQIPCQYLYFDVCIWLTVGSKCKKGDICKTWGYRTCSFWGAHIFGRFAQITNPCPNPPALKILLSGRGGGGVGARAYFCLCAQNCISSYKLHRTNYYDKPKSLPKFYPKLPEFCLNIARICSNIAQILTN